MIGSLGIQWMAETVIGGLLSYVLPTPYAEAALSDSRFFMAALPANNPVAQAH